MKIAVLTSGGDGSGTNAYIKNLYDFTKHYNYDLYGIYDGYVGLLNNKFVKLTNEMVCSIGNVGGTIIGSSRCKDFYKPEFVKKAYSILKKNKIEYLIILGGDGSFRGANELNILGQKVICVPVTIDNDLFYTDNSLGYDSALMCATMNVDCIKQTMKALNRGCLVEVMGRECGTLAYNVALATEADMVITNEYNLSKEKLKTAILNIYNSGNKCPLIVVKEHIYDLKELADYLNKSTKIDFKYSVLGYTQRGSSPSVKDRILARQFAYVTVQDILNNVSNSCIGIKNNKYISVDIDFALNVKNKHQHEIKKFFVY